MINGDEATTKPRHCRVLPTRFKLAEHLQQELPEEKWEEKIPPKNTASWLWNGRVIAANGLSSVTFTLDGF